MPGRRLQTPVMTSMVPNPYPEGAPERRLFLGGGAENMMANCVLDATAIAWAIAQIGLTIKASVDSCPPKGFGLFHALSESVCAADISAVIYGFGRIANFVSISFIHCTH